MYNKIGVLAYFLNLRCFICWLSLQAHWIALDSTISSRTTKCATLWESLNYNFIFFIQLRQNKNKKYININITWLKFLQNWRFICKYFQSKTNIYVLVLLQCEYLRWRGHISSILVFHWKYSQWIQYYCIIGPNKINIGLLLRSVLHKTNVRDHCFKY